jgi:hypothetical protein
MLSPAVWIDLPTELKKYSLCIESLYALLESKGLFTSIDKIQQAIAEREQLQQTNYSLQHKLAEYFRKKKADESRQEYDKNVTDQEQRYLKYMGKETID